MQHGSRNASNGILLRKTNGLIPKRIIEYVLSYIGINKQAIEHPAAMHPILYNFDRFVGHASQGVPDVPKYEHCHGVTEGPDERSENVTNLMVAMLA